MPVVQDGNGETNHGLISNKGEVWHSPFYDQSEDELYREWPFTTNLHYMYISFHWMEQK